MEVKVGKKWKMKEKEKGMKKDSKRATEKKEQKN